MGRRWGRWTGPKARSLLFRAGDVDDGDLGEIALWGDRDHDAVLVPFAGGEHGSVAGLGDGGLVAELFLVEVDDLVGRVGAGEDGGDHGAGWGLHVHGAVIGADCAGIRGDAEVGGGEVG